jgi:hypothetical protein
LRHIGPPSIVDPQLNRIAKKQLLQTGPSECLPAFAAENLLPLLNDFVYQQIELPLFSLLQSVVKLPYKSRDASGCVIKLLSEFWAAGGWPMFRQMPSRARSFV